MKDAGYLPETIDEYIKSYPKEIQKKLKELKSAIRSAAPKAEEKISYGMPAFTQHGNLVYFAGCKNHIGFYPHAEPIMVFSKELAKYKCSKGAVQFPLDEKLPISLIKKIVKFRVGANLQKQKDKSKKKK